MRGRGWLLEQPVWFSGECGTSRVQTLPHAVIIVSSFRSCRLVKKKKKKKRMRGPESRQHKQLSYNSPCHNRSTMTSPNSLFTHPTLQLLPKCRSLDTLKQVHAQMITTGLALHTYPLSRILHFSSTIDVPYTLSIFNQILNPTIFLFNSVISVLANHNRYTHIAFSLYERVLSHKTLRPNSFSYPSLIKACWSNSCWVQHGFALHGHMVKFLGLTWDSYVQASLIKYYANCGNLNVARYLFDQIDSPDLATWNSILSAYAKKSTTNNDDCEDETSLPLQTLNLFVEMQKDGVVKPNEVTLVAVITACANLGSLSLGLWAHMYVLKNNLVLNRFVGTALIDLYSKCGRLDLACQVFDKLSERDTLCYNAMTGGLAIHGQGHAAIGLYKRMKLEGLFPDNATFVVAMFACSHTGLVEEGCEIFESIKKVYGIEHTVEHYGCLVDLLGRAGQVKEAHEKVKMMPMKPNAILWRCLLGAAGVHGNLEVGEIALKHLIALEPETSGNYVLLSNLYASTDKWEDVRRVRGLMKENGIIKMPGMSG